MLGPHGLALEIDADPELLLRLALRHPARYPVFLDSASAGPLAQRHLLFRRSEQVICRLADGRLQHGAHHGSDDFFAALQAAYRRKRSIGTAPQWQGGWVVFIGYECAADLEPRLSLPPTPDAISAYAAYCPVRLSAVVGSGRIRIEGEPGSQAALESSVTELRAVARSKQMATPAVHCVPTEENPRRYLDAVRRAKEHIAAGDIYQANLSRAWRAPIDASAPNTIEALYRQLRRANPSPFAALLQLDDFAVLSSSPERLLAVDGDVVSTRPIAGTRARSRQPGADASEVAALVQHPKERAEHIMLIDLERNDLGRVCVGGSVEVDELLAVESYQHVHHIVSNVRGRLRAGLTPIDALRAVFPGGTITGVPKIRCMQLIAELEGAGRGAYTGSIGYLGLDGHSDFNILIRSMVLSRGELRFRTGAGIVADSDPERELEETRAKARGLLAALGAGA